MADDNNNFTKNITMTSEDLLQPGHVVKERWKVVSGRDGDVGRAWGASMAVAVGCGSDCGGGWWPGCIGLRLMGSDAGRTCAVEIGRETSGCTLDDTRS